MVNVVFYDPDSGEISASGQMTQANAEATAKAASCAYLVVDDYSIRYDQTHMVVDGALVEKN